MIENMRKMKRSTGRRIGGAVYVGSERALRGVHGIPRDRSLPMSNGSSIHKRCRDISRVLLVEMAIAVCRIMYAGGWLRRLQLSFLAPVITSCLSLVLF